MANRNLTTHKYHFINFVGHLGNAPTQTKVTMNTFPSFDAEDSDIDISPELLMQYIQRTLPKAQRKELEVFMSRKENKFALIALKNLEEEWIKNNYDAALTLQKINNDIDDIDIERITGKTTEDVLSEKIEHVRSEIEELRHRFDKIEGFILSCKQSYKIKGTKGSKTVGTIPVQYSTAAVSQMSLTLND